MPFLKTLTGDFLWNREEFPNFVLGVSWSIDHEAQHRTSKFLVTLPNFDKNHFPVILGPSPASPSGGTSSKKFRNLWFFSSFHLRILSIILDSNRSEAIQPQLCKYLGITFFLPSGALLESIFFGKISKISKSYVGPHGLWITLPPVENLHIPLYFRENPPETF